MTRKIKIAASILAADFGYLLEDIKSVEDAGADLLHIDVMDGHFVPNISIGVPVVEALKGRTSLQLDVHLMIENPEKFIKPFAEAGSDYLTVHVEAVERMDELICRIAAEGPLPGLSLNPATPADMAAPYLEKIDSVLVMTVNPGFGGQKFMPEVVSKIARLRKMIDSKESGAKIAVDGGVNSSNSPELIEAGTDILVAGTSIFGSPDRKGAIMKLRGQNNV